MNGKSNMKLRDAARIVGPESGSRDARGRFLPGNPGGPGRPRRAVEREYLAVFSDALSLDDWRQVVTRAIDDAKQGDATARAWLARYAMRDALTLHTVAAREIAGITVETELSLEGQLAENNATIRRRNSQTELMLNELSTLLGTSAKAEDRRE